MQPRQITKQIHWMGVADWNRRLFDSLIPLPDGTSYNAYLVRGSEKTVLIDTVDPAFTPVLMEQLRDVPSLDYVVSNHTEQDHSGSIPAVLEKYPQARVLCSSKAKSMIVDHLLVDPERIQVVEDNEVLSLGDLSLRFAYTPWVHWPETMVTCCPEQGILFSCDFFGSHLATSELFTGVDPLVVDGAKRYFAEIMMPFRKIIQGNMKKIRELDFRMIAPSHGPVWDHPEQILSAYDEWISDRVANSVIIPYISMHGSTEIMVDHLMDALIRRGVRVQKFELSSTELGKLAMSLVDAATIVLGTPTVLVGAHPHVAQAAYLANALRPKTRFVAIIGSFGWGSQAVEQLTKLIPNLKVEVLGTLLCKGHPRPEHLAELDSLAETIAQRHREL